MTEPGDPNQTLAADANAIDDSGAGRTGAGETTNPTVDFSALAADSLDVGLAAPFGKNAGPPRPRLGHVRPVLLKEAEGESSLVVKPTSDAIPLKDVAGDRYRFDGEIARGGMGAVLRGRDVDLGRDLAVKVLLESTMRPARRKKRQSGGTSWRRSRRCRTKRWRSPNSPGQRWSAFHFTGTTVFELNGNPNLRPHLEAASRSLNMSKVAFLGLGAMGSRMATNLLRAGHELTVWNLTPEPTKTLVASGAKPAATPREAAEGNEFNPLIA